MINKELLQKFLGHMMNTRVLALILIVGVGLLILPQGRGQSKGEEKETESLQAYCERTEHALEQLLSEAYGVGKAEVMITLSHGGQTLYAEDEKGTQTKEDKEHTYTEESAYVLKKDSGGGESPLVLQRNVPKIAGVLVLAKGAQSPTVKSEIISAVRAVLGVPAHRVEVLIKK